MTQPDEEERSDLNWLRFLGVAGLVCFFVLAPLRPTGAAGWRMGEGYATKVQVLIDQELLRTAQGANGPSIILTDEAKDHPAIEDFRDRSRLDADMADAWSDIWNIQNGKVVGISPNVHRVALPTPRDPVWTGEILFSGSPAAQTRLLLRGDMIDLVLETPDFGAPKGRQQAVLLFNGTTPKERERTIGSPIRLRAPGSAQQGRPAVPVDLAEIYLVGPTAVVAATSTVPDIEITVGDNELVAGQPKALPSGARLVLKKISSGETVWFQAVEELERGIAMSSRRLAFERQAAVDTPDVPLWMRSSDRRRAPGYEPLAYGIERAMTDLVQNEGSEALVTADLQLTLDQTMDGALRGVVGDMVDRVSRARPDDWKDFVVAVTVMDALTGDIVGMTSIEKADDPRAQARLNRQPPEVNFRKLPIGSTAKPLIAAAILERHPDLLSLEIMPTPSDDPANEDFLPHVLGAKLNRNTLASHANRRCDLSCFIQVSDNQYAATLMLLASAPDNANEVTISDPYYLNGTPQTKRKLSIFEDPNSTAEPRFNTAGAIAKVDWDFNLARFYDLSYESPSASSLFAEPNRCSGAQDVRGDDRYDMRLWRNFYATATSADPCAFKQVSPERESFLLDRQLSFQQGMLQTMIGGGEARWTNVKLAESYARLVTGRRVVANLVVAAQPQTVAEIDEMSDRVRGAVTHAMTLVTQGDGTGRLANSPNLASNLAETRQALAAAGARFGFFSKTGTPQLEVMQYQPWDRAVIGLIGGDYLLRLGADNRLRLHLGGDPIVPTLENQQEVVAALRDHEGASEIIREEGASFTVVARQLAVLNTGNREALEQEFVIEPPHLLVDRRPPDTANEDEKRFGKAYVFVAGRYGASAPSDPDTGMVANGLDTPTRAYAVAINIQNRGVTIRENLALDLAGDILSKVVGPKLLEAETGEPSRAR